MRSAILSLAVLAASAAAQEVNLAAIPACSLPCFVVAINASGCSAADYTCQCTTGKSTIQTALTDCLLATKPCTRNETIQIEPATDQLCENVTGRATGAASSVTGYGLGSMAVVVGVVSLMGLMGL